MKMNFNKFNALVIIFLFVTLELACIVSLTIDLFIYEDHNLAIPLFVLNTIILGYYLIKYRYVIKYYYIQLKKIGRRK